MEYVAVPECLLRGQKADNLGQEGLGVASSRSAGKLNGLRSTKRIERGLFSRCSSEKGAGGSSGWSMSEDRGGKVIERPHSDLQCLGGLLSHTSSTTSSTSSKSASPPSRASPRCSQVGGSATAAVGL